MLRNTAFIFLSTIILLTGCSSNKKDDDAKGNNLEPTEQTEVQLDSIYPENDRINAFLNTYNEVNPEDIITSDMGHSYYHHNQVHENQLLIDNKEGFEIIINYKGTYGIEVILAHAEKFQYMTEEEYKDQFFKYIRCYNTSITDEELDDYWAQLLEEDTHMMQYGENYGDLSVKLRIFQENIEQMIISGKYNYK